ncbi:MAG: cytochrome P450 [Rhodobiaceae bacterium]|nr:cytochrome P450 [Rhodobiaceae bacterium]
MTNAATTQSAFRYSPFAKEVMANPMPFYSELRDHHPAYYIEKFDAWVFSRFEDVWQLLDNLDSFVTTDRTVVSERDVVPHRGTFKPYQTDPLGHFSTLGSPVYEEIRQAGGKPLRPVPVKKMADDIRARCRALLDELAQRDSFDLVNDFGGAIAAGSICQIYGIDISHAREIHRAVGYAMHQDPVSGGFADGFLEHRAQLNAIALDAIRRRRAADADGSVPAIDHLLNYTLEGRTLSDEELVTPIATIMIGGSETVPKIVAHGLMILAERPDIRAQIMADPDQNLPVAFEEMVRFCGPAQWFMRTVARPITIGGQKLEVGQHVFPLIQAANRDPREFDDPDSFVWNRKMERHLGFGHGQKFCIGVHLARLEGRIMLEEVLRRFAGFRVTDAVRTPSSFQWGYSKAVLHPE